MQKILSVLFLFILFPILARGDPLTIDSNLLAKLVSAIEYQNELIADQQQLSLSGYDPFKTSFAALLEEEQIKKYLDDNRAISINSERAIAKLEGIESALNGLSLKLDNHAKRIATVEQDSARQSVLIKRNTVDISRLFYAAAVIVFLLITGGFLGHKWAHRNDSASS